MTEEYDALAQDNEKRIELLEKKYLKEKYKNMKLQTLYHGKK